MSFSKVTIIAVIGLVLGVAAAGIGRWFPAGSLLVQAQTPQAHPAKTEAALAQPAALFDRLRRLNFGMPLTGHKGMVRAVAFAPDGKAVATAGADGTVRLWDRASGQQTLNLEQPGEAVSIAFSADGKTLAAGSAGQEGAVTLWDTATGKLTLRHSHEGDWTGTVGLVERRGRVVIVVGLKRCGYTGIDARGGPGSYRATGLGGTGAVTAMARSPDGTLAAYGDADGAVYLSYQNGRIERLSKKGEGALTALSFLSGGAKVAAADGRRGIRVLDVLTAEEKVAFAGTDSVRTLAASPDGKYLATAGATSEVRLWDVASGLEERSFTAVKGAVHAVTFSPDGRQLAAVGEDGTAVVWDLASDEKPLPKDLRLAEKDLSSLWAELGSNDGGKWYAATRLLLADPARSVPFLRDRLKRRQSGTDEKRVQQLIADVDAERFETRERAAKELEKLGKHAESALRSALIGSPSAESKRRLGQLLRLIGDPVLTPVQQHDVRAVRVLEQASTPEAKKALEALATESASWWVTHEAKAALERMARREHKP